MHELQQNRMETSGLCNIRNLAIRDDGPVQSDVNGRGRKISSAGNSLGF